MVSVHGSSGGGNLPDIFDGVCSYKWTTEDVGSTHRADLLETSQSCFCVQDDLKVKVDGFPSTSAVGL